MRFIKSPGRAILITQIGETAPLYMENCGYHKRQDPKEINSKFFVGNVLSKEQTGLEYDCYIFDAAKHPEGWGYAIVPTDLRVDDDRLPLCRIKSMEWLDRFNTVSAQVYEYMRVYQPEELTIPVGQVLLGDYNTTLKVVGKTQDGYVGRWIKHYVPELEGREKLWKHERLIEYKFIEEDDYYETSMPTQHVIEIGDLTNEGVVVGIKNVDGEPEYEMLYPHEL